MKLRLAEKIDGLHICGPHPAVPFHTRWAAQRRILKAMRRGLSRSKLTPWQRERKRRRLPYR